MDQLDELCDNSSQEVTLKIDDLSFEISRARLISRSDYFECLLKLPENKDVNEYQLINPLTETNKYFFDLLGESLDCDTDEVDEESINLLTNYIYIFVYYGMTFEYESMKQLSINILLNKWNDFSKDVISISKYIRVLLEFRDRKISESLAVALLNGNQ